MGHEVPQQLSQPSVLHRIRYSRTPPHHRAPSPKGPVATGYAAAASLAKNAIRPAGKGEKLCGCCYLKKEFDFDEFCGACTAEREDPHGEFMRRGVCHA